VKPFVSIVVPFLNESESIERLTRSLFAQTYPADRFEILMADGGSTDDTLDRLRRVDPGGRVRVLDNPGRTAPAAMNVLVRAARGDVVTRVDAHSHVAPDYLERIVAVLDETGEAVVGGPARMEADTPFRRALVEALYSRWGAGSVPYRTLRTRAHVETIQTGSFRREVFERVGEWDESLAVVEDLDMNTRIREAGYRILLDPSIRFWYFPRPDLPRLWRQIHRVGRVKAWILDKHPVIFRWKYVVPTAFVLAAAGALGLVGVGVASGRTAVAAAGAAFLGAYAAAVLAFAVSRVPRIGPGAIRLLAILPTLHVGYGLGFLLGALEIPGRRRRLGYRRRTGSR